MKLKLFLSFILFYIGHAHGAFIEYTDIDSYRSEVNTDFIWDFADVPVNDQHHNYVAPDGSTVMPIVMANTLLSLGSISNVTLHNLQNTTIYLNPQLERAFIFENPIYSFGIFGLWSNIYTPDGLSVSAYDEAGNLIGTAISSDADALYTTPNGPDMNWYESFVGFNTDIAIASVYFNHEIGGAVQYDNLHIGYIEIPTPAPLALLAIGLAGIGFKRKRKA